MTGKGAMLLVLGFSLVFLVIGHNFGTLSTRATDNVTDYYVRANAHHIAVSGANMAMNEIFLDSDWDDGFSKLSISDGELNVIVDTFALDGAKITSKGTFMGFTSTVEIKMQLSSYAKFAWFVGNMSSKQFITGDTIYGPFHTQSALNIAGDPVFTGKVTTLKGLNPGIDKLAALGYDPKFYGGFESGVDIPLPSNYQFTKQEAAAIDGVTNLGGSSYFANTDLWLEFHDDETVTYRVGSGSDTSKYSAPVTVSLTTFAPNKVIYVKKGDIYVSGTLDGDVSVVAGESSGTGNGNIYVVNDVVYETDPMVWSTTENEYVPNDACDDVLSLLATNNVRIIDNEHNNKDKDVRIDAAIFCAQGGFELDNKLMPPSGSLYLRGSMIAAKEEVIAQIDAGGNVTNGYKKHVIFDERYLLNYPYLFPSTDTYEVVSWYE